MSTTPQDVGNPLASGERRQHRRHQTSPFAYVELGEENGGIALNISEEGFALTTVEPLPDDYLPRMRIQLPRSKDWIEASGEIMWKSESKKEAGICFVDLSKESRTCIRGWVSSEALQGEPAASIDASRKQTERVVEMPVTREPKRVIPRPAASDEVFQGSLPTLISLSNLVSAPQVHDAPDTVPVPDLPLSEPTAETSIKSTPEPTDERVAVGARRRRWGMLPVYASFLAILSFVAGITAGAGWNRVVGFLGRLTHSWSVPAHVPEASSSVNVAVVPPGETSNVNNVNPQVPASSAQGSFEANTRSQAASVMVAKPPANKDAASAFTPGSPAPTRVLKPSASGNPPREPSGSETLAAPSPSASPPQVQTQIAVDNSTAKSSQGVSNPATDSASPPQLPTPTPEVTITPAPVSPPPTSSAPVNAEKVVGSVTIHSDPYPSIRVPPELKAQMSKLGTSLQMGGLISRVDPTYPEEAERQHIEGTVKLHAIIGTDGAIRSVEVVSGPPLLAQAAVRAVQQWRYKQTFLGGWPIETEEDVVAVFRLQTQKIR